MEVSKITPMYDKIIVEPVEEKQDGIFVIPESAKERPRQGIVVAKGPGVDGKRMDTMVGDLILFGKFAGSEIPLEEGRTFLLMRDTPDNNDVIAVLERKQESIEDIARKLMY